MAHIHGNAYIDRTRQEMEDCLAQLQGENAKLRARLEAVYQELQQQLDANARELDESRDACVAARTQITELAQEGRRFAELYAEVEQRNTNLANLYVASYQLHGTLDRANVLDAIHEIIINLIGSEQFAVYEREAGDDMLRLVTSFGIDPELFDTIPVGTGIIGATVSLGQPYFGENGQFDSGVDAVNFTACVPLRLDDKVTGAIAIFKLLPQKRGLEEVDYELFDLLATHAATALYATRLVAREHEHAAITTTADATA